MVRPPVAEGGRTEVRVTVASFSGCAHTSSAASGASPPASFAPESNFQGRFRTCGRFSSATVRGTQWDTRDRCEGTQTRVVRGVVVVHDLRTGRDSVLGAGQSLLVPASGSAPAVPTGEARMTQCPPGDANNPSEQHAVHVHRRPPGRSRRLPTAAHRVHRFDDGVGNRRVHVTADARGIFTDTHTFPATTGGFTYGADAISRYPDDPLSPGQGSSFTIR